MKKQIILGVFLFLLMNLNAVGQNVDVITADQLSANNVGYASFVDKQFGSGVVYSGITALGENNTIKLSDNSTNTPRIVTTNSNRKIKSIAFQWNAATTTTFDHALAIYGKNSPYQKCDINKDFDKDYGNLIGYVKNGNNNTIDLSSSPYKHLGFFAYDAIYLDKITITWGKIMQEVHFPLQSYKVNLGDVFESPVLESLTPVLYSSSNEKVALVDENTGKVTIMGAGETTITGICAETDDYEKVEAQYRLIVNEIVESKTFDFKDPKSFGLTAADNKPDAAYGWDIDITRSLVLDNCDVVVTATAPKEYRQPRFYTDSGNFTGLRCYSGGTVTFTVPKGIQIVQVDPIIAQTQPFKTITSENSVSYSYAADAVGTKNEMCISRANVSFKGAYELNISDAGYATWCAQRPYVLPLGLQGGIVSINAESSIATVDYRVQPGDIVAPGTALLIKGAPGKYTLIPVKEKGIKFSDTENLLRPAITTDPIKAPGDKQFFVFALKNNRLGFYWQKGQKGDGVQNIPNKAYLEVPRALTAGSQGFRLDLGEQTGLDVHTYPQTKSDAVYNLSGTKVGLSKENLPHGIYIINGKKIFVK